MTFSLYQTMGITEAIVATDEEYVDVAIKFGTDRNKRMDYSAVLAAKSPLLFGETGSLLAYEEFLFKSVVKKI